MRRFVIAIWMMVAAAQLPAAEKYRVDWGKVGPEALEHFLALLRIDTSDPPGNETKAALYLLKALERENISSRILALDPTRANLLARLPGNGSKRPVLIMGHTDVVGVQKAKWSVDPFAAIRKGGYIYARGARDDKPHVAAGLMLMLLLKRLNVKLDRDVIFLAEAGEEGTTRVGIDFLVERHWKEIEAEYALAEGGSIFSRDGTARRVVISTTEKIPRPVRLIAHGTAGHASVPRLDNAVVRLAAAVAKVGAWQPPMRLNDTTRAYFERLATVSTPEEAYRYTHILDPAQAPEIERYFAEHDPFHYSVLRTSISPTLIRAGFRSNVIPSEADAYLDVRALPDEDMDKICAELRRIIADPNVEVVPTERKGRPAGAASRIDTDMFRALETAQQRLFPSAVTLPSMLTGATDMAQLRARGVQAYGFGPIVDEKDREVGSAHTDDERIPEGSLEKMLEFLWTAVLEVAASKP
jgi:acetylornithine deacetylase/succinyl-diaminopimelate desuccinylase-like protein